MVDPALGLVSLQHELDQGNALVRLTRCQFDHSLFYIIDKQSQGGLRLSYATRSGSTLTALVQLVAAEPCKGVRGFSIGYAVPEQYRRRGLGTAGVIAGLAEFDKAFAGRLGRYFIEAVVGVDNIASQRIAERVLGGSPQKGRDQVSGLRALRYVRQFSATEIESPLWARAKLQMRSRANA